MGKMLYDQLGQLNDCLICEIDAIIKLNTNTISDTVNTVQDRIDFEDARSVDTSNDVQGEFNNKDMIKERKKVEKKDKKYY